MAFPSGRSIRLWLRGTVLAVAAGTTGFGLAADNQALAPLGWIEIAPDSGAIILRANVAAQSAAKGESLLSIERKGPSGTARLTQGSPFDLAAGERVVVTQTGLSFSAGDMLTATLTISTDDGATSTATFVHGE